MNTVSLSRAVRTAVVGLVLALASLAGLALASSATAAPNYPPTGGCDVSASITTTAQIGSTVGITGSGFEPGSSVTLTQTPGGQSLGKVDAGSDGSFDTTVTLSAVDVSVVASSGSQTCGTTQLGTDAANDNRNDSNNNSAPSETASTGFQSLTATLIAAFLLVGGAALVLAGRRRTSRG